jgi:hypothetical protein
VDTPETMFDEQLAAAGAAIEVCANMSAFANHLLFKCEQLAEQQIPESDRRVTALRDLLEIFEERIAPGFALATQKDPTGPRGAGVTRPWRDPKLVSA